MFAELGIYEAPRAKSIPRYKPFVAMSSFTRRHIFFSWLFSSNLVAVYKIKEIFRRSRFQNSLQRKQWGNLLPAISFKTQLFLTLNSGCSRQNDIVMSGKTVRPAMSGNTSALRSGRDIIIQILFDCCLHWQTLSSVMLDQIRQTMTMSWVLRR